MDFLYGFDISKGYHHVDIWEGHQMFLGFSWKIDEKRKFFVFTVLAVGITSGPFIFTKFVHCLLKHWRSLGIKTACFIDDGLGTASSLRVAYAESNIVRSTLISAGFVINDKKSIWNPTQNITWLGFQFSSLTYTMPVTEYRCTSLLRSVESCIMSLPYSTQELGPKCVEK